MLSRKQQSIDKLLNSMKKVVANLSEPVKMYGNSIGRLEIKADSENEALSLAQDWESENEEDGEQGLGIVTESHFNEDGVYYFAIVKIS